MITCAWQLRSIRKRFFSARLTRQLGMGVVLMLLRFGFRCRGFRPDGFVFMSGELCPPPSVSTLFLAVLTYKKAGGTDSSCTGLMSRGLKRNGFVFSHPIGEHPVDIHTASTHPRKGAVYED